MTYLLDVYVLVALIDPGSLSGHHFWPDDLSLIASDLVDPGRILTSAQVIDTYLLALAKTNRGKLATFDRRLSVAAVKGGKAALHTIEG